MEWKLISVPSASLDGSSSIKSYPSVLGANQMAKRVFARAFPALLSPTRVLCGFNFDPPDSIEDNRSA